jgi:hypothetical protein
LPPGIAEPFGLVAGDDHRDDDPAFERQEADLVDALEAHGPDEEWKEVLGSDRLTGATLDRLTHRCTIVETGKESYRLREARKRRRGPAAELPASTVDDGSKKR